MIQIRSLVGSKEYSEFKNLVILLENSFVEINKNGTGIQQVQLAISPEFLLTASYVSLDPSSTTLELVNVIPLDYLRISTYSCRHRRIRICYCTGFVRYYELSERNNSSSVWRNWCDRIQFLNGEMLSSSVSDVSIKTDRGTSNRSRAGGNKTLSQLDIKKSHTNIIDLVDKDALKQVSHILDLSGEPTSKDDIGVVVNKSVFELVKSCSQPGVKYKKSRILDETIRSRNCVPRFASGVSEKCENHLTLGEFATQPKPKISTKKKTSEIVLCPKDTVTINVVKECSSDTSIYFSPRGNFELVDDDEETGKKTVRLYFTPRDRIQSTPF